MQTAVAEEDSAAAIERVAVLPLWFDPGLTVGETLSTTVQKNIMFILRFFSEYELIESEKYPDEFSDISAYAEAQAVDTVIFGRVSSEGGRYAVSLRLYSREFDKIMSTREDSVSSYMDMFDLSDRLSMLILEDYQERALDFGSLAFLPQPGGMENYRVLIDGRSAGEGIRDIPFLEAGEYTLQIEEFYEDGRTREIVNETVTIEAEQETAVSFDQYPYTEVQIVDEGAGLPFSVTLGDVTVQGEGRAEAAVPPGVCSVSLTQPDYRGEPYLLKEISLDVELGTLYTVTVVTRNLGRGVEFRPQRRSSAEGNAAFEGDIFIGEEPVQGLAVEVLPLGTYPVRIYQMVEGERLLVYAKEFSVSEDKDRIITFPLFAARKEWAHYQKNGEPSLSVEMQALDGSYGQMGFRWEGLMRRLGLSLLAGAHFYDETLWPTVKAKVQWLPLGGGSVISPELGVFARMDYSQDKLFYTVGPQLGLTWNTGFPVLTSVFVENDLRWNPEGPFHLFYYVSVGVRLF